MNTKHKLELVWPTKNQRVRPEPRILIDNATFKSSKAGIQDNLLIQGDNLLGLKTLESTYMGKIKCIYIDPPYNTKSCFAHYDDSMEHSLWLDMIKERLIILQRLLSEDGSIWISIDDSECHYLKVLCDEIFGRKNYIATLPTIMNLKGNQDQFGFAGTHEYTLVFAKCKEKLLLNQFLIEEEEVLIDWKIDSKGYYKLGANLKATGQNAPRSKRPNLFYPIYVGENNELSSVEKAGYKKILPVTEGREMSWRWSKDKLFSSPDETIIIRSGCDISIYKKQRPNLGDLPTKKPKSIFYKPEYSSGNGTNQIKQLFGKRNFDYPKPEHLIQDFLTIATNPGDLVLDCFAGSGTTGAVAHKMGRKWIMIEMGDHAKTHIIPRLKLVIEGKDAGGITQSTQWKGGGGFRFAEIAPSLLKKDSLDRLVINPKYTPHMLKEAMCMHAGFRVTEGKEPWWCHGQSSQSDFIYVTPSTLTKTQLALLSNEVGPNRSLLVFCGAFTCKVNEFDNLTIEKIPKSVLSKCDWESDDYSLKSNYRVTTAAKHITAKRKK